MNPATPAPCVQALTETKRFLTGRLGTLAAVLILELIVFRAWLDHISPDISGNSFYALLIHRGPGTLRFALVRFAVVFATVGLIFAVSQRVADRLAALLERLGRPKVAWSLFAAHGFAAFLLGALSMTIFGASAPTILSGPATAMSIVAGCFSVLTVALAFLPAAIWAELFSGMRPIILLAAVASAGSYAIGEFSTHLWSRLSSGTFHVSYALLHPFVPQLSADPTTLTIGTSDFYVQIARECSGLEGLGLMSVITGVWLWVHRDEWRFPQAFALIPAGLICIWIVNSLRVAGLVLIGITGAPEIAVAGFHTQAGWIAFNTVALGICLGARHVTWLTGTREPAFVGPCTQHVNPTTAYLMPMLAILGASMIVQLGSTGFDWLYSVRVIACTATLWYFRDSYRTLDWHTGWLPVVLGVAVFAAWVWLEPVSPMAMPSALRGAPDLTRMAWILFRVLGTIVTVPIAEELAFRGFLLRRCHSAKFESVEWSSVSWIAVVLSSLAFGLLHGERWVAGTVAGVVYSYAMLRRGSIGDAVTAHATTNALLAATVFITGNWQFW